MNRLQYELILVAGFAASLTGCSGKALNGSQLDAQAMEALFQQAQEKIRSGEFEGALQDLNTILASEPDHAEALTARGSLYHARGQFGPAIADLDQAIPLNPASPSAAKELAWILATCREDQHRDGQRAVQVARIALLRGHDDWRNLDSLAAALAETGDFDGAIKYQTLLLHNPPLDKAAELQERLESYKQQKPWRE